MAPNTPTTATTPPQCLESRRSAACSAHRAAGWLTPKAPLPACATEPGPSPSVDLVLREQHGQRRQQPHVQLLNGCWVGWLLAADLTNPLLELFTQQPVAPDASGLLRFRRAVAQPNAVATSATARFDPASAAANALHSRARGATATLVSVNDPRRHCPLRTPGGACATTTTPAVPTWVDPDLHHRPVLHCKDHPQSGQAQLVSSVSITT